MPPRLHVPSRVIATTLKCRQVRQPLRQRCYATAAITPAASHEQMTLSPPPIARFPSTQPPSYKPPEFRKSQLLRQYVSLLRATPLMLLFQHNNLKSGEWVGIRRELTKALRKVDETQAAAGYGSEPLADGIKIQIIQTGIFAAALRVVEYFKPTSQQTPSDGLTHALSIAAHEAVADTRRAHALAPLLSGPLMLVTFPNVSPQHMKVALSILAPAGPDFPAPTRRANPGYHDVTVQSGLQKLLLLGARVEGRVFDVDGTKWVGKIEGGLDGLRAQLVAMLQGAGAGITNALESAGRSLYFTVESRHTMLEEDGKEASDTPEK